MIITIPAWIVVFFKIGGGLLAFFVIGAVLVFAWFGFVVARSFARK